MTGNRLLLHLVWFALIVIWVCALCSCVQPVHTWAPPLDRPDRPTLEYISAEELETLPETTRMKLIANNERLQLYARKLEAMIDGYNEWRNGQLKASEKDGEAAHSE